MTDYKNLNYMTSQASARTTGVRRDASTSDED